MYMKLLLEVICANHRHCIIQLGVCAYETFNEIIQLMNTHHHSMNPIYNEPVKSSTEYIILIGYM